MGVVETEAKKKRLYTNVQRLCLLRALTGVTLVAAIAPECASGASAAWQRRAQLRYRYRNGTRKIGSAGTRRFEKHDGRQYARITELGRKILAFEQEKAKLKEFEKKCRWNERWRVILFDITRTPPSNTRSPKNHNAGNRFVRLQDSVWVPYDCEDFIALLKAELKIGAAVLYMVVEHIENDKHLRAHFGLK